MKSPYRSSISSAERRVYRSASVAAAGGRGGRALVLDRDVIGNASSSDCSTHQGNAPSRCDSPLPYEWCLEQERKIEAFRSGRLDSGLTCADVGKLKMMGLGMGVAHVRRHWSHAPPRAMAAYIDNGRKQGPPGTLRRTREGPASPKALPPAGEHPAESPPPSIFLMKKRDKKAKKKKVHKKLGAKQKRPASTGAKRADRPCPQRPKGERRVDTVVVAAIHKRYAEMPTEKALALARAIGRGVTMRASGKWQAQLYYHGKSRYIGVFESRVKATMAYEIVRELLKSDSKTEKCDSRFIAAQKAAFEAIDEPVRIKRLEGGKRKRVPSSADTAISRGQPSKESSSSSTRAGI